MSSIDLRHFGMINLQGSIYRGTFTNYTDLSTSLPIANFGDAATVEDSEGTQYLPFSWGGTYWPEGTYYFDGAGWVSNVEDLAKAIQDINDTIITGDLPCLLVKESSTPSVPATLTEMTFDTTVIENDSNTIEHDNTNTERLQIKETGLYMVDYDFIQLEGAVAGDTVSDLRIDSTTTISCSNQAETTVNGFKFHKGRGVPVELTAGQYITLRIGGGSGTLSDICVYVIKQQGIKGNTGNTGAGANIIAQKDDITIGTTTDTLNFEGTAVTGSVDEGGNKSTITINGNPDSIHDNISGEINAITEKTTIASADEVLIEDSEDSFSKKKVSLDVLLQGGTATEAFYTFDNNTSATDPTAGNFKFDNGTQSSATNIYIDILDENGVDRSSGILVIPIGTIFLIRSARDVSRFHQVQTTGLTVDNTGWFTIPITVIDSGTDIQNNSLCSISSIIKGVPDASTTVKGIVELATQAETETGTDTTRAVTPDGLSAAISRLTEWNPVCMGNYTVGAGATLTLTSDSEGYKFGYNDSQNDKTYYNIPLHDPVSQLMYDGSDIEITIYYYTPTAANLDVAMAVNYNILGDGDDFDTGGVTQMGELVVLDGNVANELQSYVFVETMSGTADDNMLKMNFERAGSLGTDTYTDDFFITGFTMRRV